MICKCGGTGFITVVGKYRSTTTGTLHDDVLQSRRCPAYLEYWLELKDICHITEGVDRKKKLSILSSAKTIIGGCEAAVKVHRELKDQEHEHETKRRDRV